MQPTMKLRVIKRGWKNVHSAMGMQFGGHIGKEPVLILQQWWETEWPHDNVLYKGEWRDIPLEEEQ